MIKLPIDYVTNIFFQYSGKPEKVGANYKASCPICMEGQSWGIRKRLYYFPEKRYFYCHNGCGGFSDYFWVKTVTGKSFLEIKEEIETSYNSFDFEYERIFLENPKAIDKFPDLPNDSINLLDKTQVKFYKNDYWVKEAVSFIMRRKILNAPYRPKTFYLSHSDFLHKNRIIIPFFNGNTVDYYQSRALSKAQEKRSKFLCKMNSEKPLFNFNLLDYSLQYIFIMEGPIDCMFLKNSVAICGADMTDYQLDLINREFPYAKKIWIYDNHKIDTTAYSKIKDLSFKSSSDLFFNWSDQFEKYKDINEFCVNENINEINPQEILDRSFSGPKILLSTYN